MLFGSLEAALATNQRLLKAIDDYDIALIVPGHAPLLTRHEAKRIGHEDIAHVRSLQAAAADAVQSGASAAAVFVAASSVEPPRDARRDFEAFGLRGANARKALSELGHETVAGW